MRAETRALAWLHWRRLRGSLLLVPAALAVGTLVLAWVPLGAPPAELLLIALGPFAAAAAGASTPGSGEESERGALAWLKTRAVDPRRLLTTGLAGQLACLASSALAAGALVAFLTPRSVPFARGVPGDAPLQVEAIGRWSAMLDAPFAQLLALAALLWAAAFLWGLALAWFAQPLTTAMLGGTLLAWFLGSLLVVPGALIGGRPEEVLASWPLLVPGFLAPPAVLAAWAFGRWPPLARPWPGRRLATVFTVACALGLVGWAFTLQAPLEARVLSARGPIEALHGVESVLQLPHPDVADLMAHELRLASGATRVVLDDGEASRTVLPRGTRLVGRVQPFARGRPAWQLQVQWSDGRNRRIHADGRTSPALPLELVERVQEPEVRR